jgi:dUTP pyrophosphatase
MSLTEPLIVMFKSVHPSSHVPLYATDGSAGCDFYSVESMILQPGETRKIRTGIAIEIPRGYFLKLEGRSGLSSRGILASGGVVDSDYRGEIHIILTNTTLSPFNVQEGDRIAQGVFMLVNQAHFHEIDRLSETKRGTGGFQSTGMR